MSGRVAWGRVSLLTVAAGFAIATYKYASPAAVASKESLGILVTTFSVLAGILVAVYTVLGDPQALYPGTWRTASLHKKEVLRALARYDLLFYLYLGVLSLSFLAALMRCSEWIARAALSLGAFALVLSFGLPQAVARAQKDRLEQEVEGRRTGT